MIRNLIKTLPLILLLLLVSSINYSFACGADEIEVCDGSCGSGEYICGTNDEMCCTGGGCPSINCSSPCEWNDPICDVPRGGCDCGGGIYDYSCCPSCYYIASPLDTCSSRCHCEPDTPHTSFSGNIKYVPEGSPVQCSTGTNMTTANFPGLAVTVRDSDGEIWTDTSVDSNGNYSISPESDDVVGPTVTICITNLPSDPVYVLQCKNGAELPGTANCYSGIPISRDNTTTTNMMFWENVADPWLTTNRGIIMTSTISGIEPPRMDPTSSFYLAGIENYLLGYDQTPQKSLTLTNSVLTSIDNYTQSDLYGEGLSQDATNPFLVDNNAIFENIANFIPDLNTSNLPANYHLVSSSSPGSAFIKNHVYVFTHANALSNLPLSPRVTESNGTTAASGVALLIDKATTGTLNIPRTIASTNLGRLMIMTTRDVVIGAQVAGHFAPESIRTNPGSDIRVGIITTKNITITDYSGGTSGTLILEGPLVAGGNIILDRDLGPVANGINPAAFIRYNPAYIIQLRNLMKETQIPNGLGVRTFNYVRKEIR